MEAVKIDEKGLLFIILILVISLFPIYIFIIDFFKPLNFQYFLTFTILNDPELHIVILHLILQIRPTSGWVPLNLIHIIHHLLPHHINVLISLVGFRSRKNRLHVLAVVLEVYRLLWN